MTTRYIYVLEETELGALLADRSIPVEVLDRKGSLIIFATYEPLEGFKPVRKEHIGDVWKRWKNAFGPVDVEDFVVMPPWKVPVFINPGMAFGTGLHPTTQLCIKAVREEVHRGDTFLDVGTGSGILSIVAKLLGAERVLGIDISEEAINASKENAKLNKVDIEFRLCGPHQVDESFDIVVANLELGIFEKELHYITPLFKRVAIFSGIYRRDELKEFLDLLSSLGVKEDKIISQEDWYCVVARRWASSERS